MDADVSEFLAGLPRQARPPHAAPSRTELLLRDNPHGTPQIYIATSDDPPPRQIIRSSTSNPFIDHLKAKFENQINLEELAYENERMEREPSPADNVWPAPPAPQRAQPARTTTAWAPSSSPSVNPSKPSRTSGTKRRGGRRASPGDSGDMDVYKDSNHDDDDDDDDLDGEQGSGSDSAESATAPGDEVDQAWRGVFSRRTRRRVDAAASPVGSGSASSGRRAAAGSRSGAAGSAAAFSHYSTRPSGVGSSRRSGRR
ncbi:hypothetical protein HK105_202745 [Polyrhizophydium stewartii]|uniref:Uncharacterized protein n=1 Tax=Polyrhizophydium stewartii TaxID=2732419 RepID=A0ABR4NEC5_9FUNG